MRPGLLAGAGVGAGLALAAAAGLAQAPDPSGAPAFTPGEIRVLRSLALDALGPPPDDPSNAYDTDPRAARLGLSLFLDTRFSANGQVACMTCHLPGFDFQDAKPRAQGVGQVRRRSMTLIGAGYQTWLFWDGRKDSLWAQALAPLESPVEHGISRTRVADLVRSHYRDPYEAIFGPMPSLPGSLPANARPAGDDARARQAWLALAPEARQAITRVYVNAGKAIAAFVRTIRPGPAPFDRYVQAVLAGDAGRAATILTPAQVRGLKLFIGGAGCTNCHSGPLFTNGEFHRTGVPPRPGEAPDRGRAEGLPLVLVDEFNCATRHSDASADRCTAIRFARRDPAALERAFRVPTLRNVAVHPPYMHAGQVATLRDVLALYRRASARIKDLEHGALTDAELADLEAFLTSLTGPVQSLQ